MVEDDPDNQIMMRAIMKSRYRMLTAASPAEVYRQIEIYHGSIDIILMDLGLHGTEDGLALTRSLRGLERFRTTPIVALTAHAMTVDRDQALCRMRRFHREAVRSHKAARNRRALAASIARLRDLGRAR